MRRFLRFALMCAPAVLVPEVLSAQGNDLTAVGIVAEVKGKWSRVRDKKLLDVSDEIFPGTTVRSEASTASSIKVAMFDGSVWNKVCSIQAPCNGSYAIPSPPQPERGFLAFFSTYFTARKRVPVIFTASRGVGRNGPQEEVLTVSRGAIDLSAALEGVASGRWRVTLSDPGRPRHSGLTRTVDWPSAATLQIGSRAPGIYALDLQSETGETLGPPAAILLVDAQSGSGARDEFAKAKELAASWRGVDAAAIRAFLVQALYAIELEAKR